MRRLMTLRAGAGALLLASAGPAHAQEQSCYTCAGECDGSGCTIKGCQDGAKKGKKSCSSSTTYCEASGQSCNAGVTGLLSADGSLVASVGSERKPATAASVVEAKRVTGDNDRVERRACDRAVINRVFSNHEVAKMRRAVTVLTL
jgi:hypothetical protein